MFIFNEDLRKKTKEMIEKKGVLITILLIIISLTISFIIISLFGFLFEWIVLILRNYININWLRYIIEGIVIMKITDTFISLIKRMKK